MNIFESRPSTWIFSRYNDEAGALRGQILKCDLSSFHLSSKRTSFLMKSRFFQCPMKQLLQSWNWASGICKSQSQVIFVVKNSRRLIFAFYFPHSRIVFIFTKTFSLCTLNSGELFKMVESWTQPEIDFWGRLLILTTNISIICFICVRRQSIFSILSVTFYGGFDESWTSVTHECIAHVLDRDGRLRAGSYARGWWFLVSHLQRQKNQEYSAFVASRAHADVTDCRSGHRVPDRPVIEIRIHRAYL